MGISIFFNVLTFYCASSGAKQLVKKKLNQNKLASKDLPNKSPIVIENNSKQSMVSKAAVIKKGTQNAQMPKLPTLVPRCNVFDKKGGFSTLMISRILKSI